MIVQEFKIKAKPHQYEAIDEAIRTLNIVGHTKIYAPEETPSWLVGSALLANGDSLNRESPS